jgi:hypothetical protein
LFGPILGPELVSKPGLETHLEATKHPNTSKKSEE